MYASARRVASSLALQFAAVVLLLSTTQSLSAQTTVGTGSIVGTVSDPSGAVISGAEITITNFATGQLLELTTNSSGFFNSGALVPGNYKALVAAKGFSAAEVTVTLRLGS